MRYVLIVNPASGGRAHGEKLTFVQRYFSRHGLDLEVVTTSSPGDATQLAKKAANAGADVVVGAGGDGTINEVVEGLIGTSTRLGILPWGTGNVFAAEMRFPTSLRAQCRVLRKNRSQRFDVGRVTNGRLRRHFLLMFSAGFDAYSLRQLGAGELKRRFGTLAYAIAAFRALWRYRFPEIEIHFPDGSVERGAFVLVSNTRLYGRFFSFAPAAIPTDGWLDVTILRDRTRWRTLGFLFKALWGAMTGKGPRLGRETFRDAIYLRSRSLRLSGPKNLYAQWDGDVRSGLPVSIDLLPAELAVVVPHARLWNAVPQAVANRPVQGK